MFWDKFYQLCRKNNTWPNPVAKELGYSNAVCTRWGNGTLPKAEALIKISNYFNVSIDYLLEDEIANERRLRAQIQQAQAEENQPQEGKPQEQTKEQKNKPDKKVKAKKIKKDKEKELILNIEFASAPPDGQPDLIIEEINGKKRIANFKDTEEVWLQTAAYEGIFPSFDKKAGYLKYTASELEKLMNEDDLKL